MHKSCDIAGVNVADLACLNWWPDDSPRYAETQKALEQLVALCDKHGYGGLPQMAEGIQAIWRNPNKIAHFQELKDAHFVKCGWKK